MNLTQKSEAQKGNVTPEMEYVAKNENIDVNKLMRLIDAGKIVIPKNINGNSKACGIGEGLKTKVNANIGSSSKIDDIELEINKAKLAKEYGADALMDLSTGSDLKTFRKKIMDAVDFLVSDIKGGVFNAMMRYEDSFNPDIRPYFSECIDDVKNKGASFEEAMLKLNAALGITFTDFAYKAIIYEAKADDGLEDLFSSIIETNRNKRNLRYINNIEFNNLKVEFLGSMGIILLYVIYSVATDEFTRWFISTQAAGKILIIVDIIIVAVVMAFITSIKSKSL